VWLLRCGGAFFGVGHQSGEAWVAMERFKRRIFLDLQSVLGG
jgi:hypothetical protein